MTKKRIADLLKEEVEKSNQAEPAPAEGESQTTDVKLDKPETTEAASNKAHGKTAAGTTGRSRKRTTRKSSTTVEKASQATANNSVALEKKIRELESSLQQAQEQISGLQGDIKTHQDRIFELKDELEASKQSVAEKSEALAKATEELETAKETIRQITAVQEKERETKAQADEAAAKPQVIHGADLATNRSTLSLRNRPGGYKAIPDYAIQRGEQNSMLSDDDIGWVD